MASPYSQACGRPSPVASPLCSRGDREKRWHDNHHSGGGKITWREASAKPNLLIFEKSPYLLEHAHNPVDWYPWGSEAFDKASKENKPIFLSIGYSTCHWCHVMARESFEDAEIASLLNAEYVSIKVDREERPDIDHAYMRVCLELTGQGGWPLTIIMTPGKVPLFAGTYFPKEARFNLPGLIDILRNGRELWEGSGGSSAEAGRRAIEAIRGANARRGASSGEPLGSETLDLGFGELSLSFDERHGGFGAAPKFPMPHSLIFLIRYWRLTGRARALECAERTLLAMRDGGIFDQVGHGFSRYSTDSRWGVPHFEKMLYDNALLAYAYLEAYQATRKREYAAVAGEIFGYLEREMTSPEGAFYSAEDADSEGVEGKFYRWSEDEIKGVLGPDDGGAMSRIYGIEGDGGKFEGVPNLILGELWKEADERGMPPSEMIVLYESWRRRLFEAREKRVKPAKDRKILTSWNGLAIAALAKGSVVLGDPGLRGRAERAARFLLKELKRPDGRLLARFLDGEAKYPAYLDDYSFLAWGLFELYEATFDPFFIEEAISLTREMLSLFWDREGSGFFFDGKDASELPFRPKEVQDGALPSGNSVAAMNLLKLSRMTGDVGFERDAVRLFSTFSTEVSQYPSSHTFFLMALHYALGPSQELVVAGDPGGKDTAEMLEKIRPFYLPNSIFMVNPAGSAGQRVRSLAGALRGKEPVHGRATFYLCENRSCRTPTTDPEEVERLLKEQ